MAVYINVPLLMQISELICTCRLVHDRNFLVELTIANKSYLKGKKYDSLNLSDKAQL
jgi:hypothetical protein